MCGWLQAADELRAASASAAAAAEKAAALDVQLAALAAKEGALDAARRSMAADLQRDFKASPLNAASLASQGPGHAVYELFQQRHSPLCPWSLETWVTSCQAVVSLSEGCLSRP